MKKFAGEDVSIMMERLVVGDNYEEAIQHFMSLIETTDVIDRSVDLPQEKRPQVERVLAGVQKAINDLFQLKNDDQLQILQLLYVPEFNLVHGVLIGKGIFGAAILFPALGKGAASIINQNDKKTHYVRVSSILEPRAEA